MSPGHHHPHSRSRVAHFKLERWHRWTLYGVGLALLATGLLWLLAHYFMRVQGEFGETPHPLEHLAIQIHGALAMPALFFVGSLLNNHMRRAYYARRNLGSAWVLVAALSYLCISALGLYYLATDTSRTIWSMSHWILGLTLPILLVLHIRYGRKSTKQQS
jgi:hypothetical protein